MAPFLISPHRLARYFYHDCDRYLRYHATPPDKCSSSGVPLKQREWNPVTRAVLESGLVWENEAIGQMPQGSVHLPPGDGSLQERKHDVADTLALLAQIQVGESIYQGALETPLSLYERLGVSTDLVRFPTCYPDLMTAVSVEGRPRIRVVDLKASDELKASHRLQVAFYVLILQELFEVGRIPVAPDLSQGGVWLPQKDAPTLFNLSTGPSMLESFFRDSLPDILESPVTEVPWHLGTRCEWCDFYPSCRQEAESKGSVSLLPYLSGGARRFLRTYHAVDTLEQLDLLLSRPDVDELLDACGSLSGRTSELRNSVESLLTGRAVPQAGSVIQLPKFENVRIVLSLQREPASGLIYALGFRRLQGKKAFGTGSGHEIFVAASPARCTEVQAAFLRSLFEELTTIHGYNLERSWRDQLTVQVYVLDGYERELLLEVLFNALADPDLVEPATALLFHFQNEELARSNEHPRQEVPYPVVALNGVVRRLMALPTPVVTRLAKALELLPDPGFDFTYQPGDLFSYELRDALRADAILMAWANRPEMLQRIETEIKRKMIAVSTLVGGLRHAVKDKLFSYPPKFQWQDQRSFVHAELSKLHFVVRYESLMSALAQRQKRCEPWETRLRDSTSLILACLGGGVWRLEQPVQVGLLEVGAFPRYLLVPLGPPGERDQMAYNDYTHRQSMRAPKDSGVRLAAVTEVLDESDYLVSKVRLELKEHELQREFQAGNRAVLHPRFTDFTSARIVRCLEQSDFQEDALLLRLLRDPCALAGESPGGQAGLQPPPDFTASQRQAFEHMLAHRLTLIWGPPGTGKTHLLAGYIGAGLQRPGSTLRVGVTAFTHAAVENLLDKLLAQAPTRLIGKIGGRSGPGIIGLDKSRASSFSDPGSVLGGTVYGLAHAISDGLEPFDVLVVDEGSQVRWGELALICPALAPGGRLVIAGDDLQLPPIIKGKYPTPEDGLPGLQDSVFAYLRARDPERAFTRQLLENWRMNDTLSRFPAETLYGMDFRPATPELSSRSIVLSPTQVGPDPLLDHLLAPEFPLVVGIFDGLQAGQTNPVEAELVARISHRLRTCLDNAGDDRAFWKESLFVVSPHHKQIRAIHQALASIRNWAAPPFVDTVDKMQGREAEVVLVSYGVSDEETALAEAEFLYSLNRLNVAITRARSKCIILLSAQLLQSSYELLAQDKALEGFGFMHSLLGFCRRHGRESKFDYGSASLRVLRACWNGAT